MTIGQRIRSLRESKCMTQQDLADKMKTAKQNISRYENDRIKDIPMSTISRLSAALDTTPADLLGFSDNGTIGVYVYDKESRVIKQRRMNLHQLIDEAPDDMLSIMELVLTMPEEQLRSWASLIGYNRSK